MSSFNSKTGNDQFLQTDQAWDAVETYFECITTCSVNDRECITRCVEALKDDND